MSAVNPLHGFDAAQGKPPAASEQRAYEPSMEEILASIRRIIADDQSLPNRAAPNEGLPVTPNAHVPAKGEHQGQALQAEQAPQPTPPADAFTGMPASVTMLHQVMQGRRADAALASLDADGAQAVPDAGPAMPPDTHQDMQGHGHIAAPQFASPAGPAMHPDDEPGHHDHAIHDDAASQADPADDEVSGGQDGATLFSNATDRSVTGAFNTLAAMRLANNSEDLLGLARDMIRPLLKSWLDDNLPGMVERMVRAEIERVARGGR